MALTKVSSSLVSDSAVTSGKIADGGVATADIATNAVTSTKIAQNSILTKHIDDGQVTTDQLGADAVTAAKIADDAISEEHLDITVITSLTAVTAATGDLLMVADVSDSNNLKKIPVSSILAGTLTNAAQTNITSVGTLTGLNVAGTPTFDGLTVDGSTALNNSSAGTTVATFNGTYSGSGDVQLAKFQRNGGAVATAITYADATTDMEFGTTTGHSLSLTTGDTRRLTITSAGAATFTGAVTSTGVVTANAGVVVDNFTLNGTTLALSSGDMTLDAAGDIILDADGANIIFKDGGTSFGKVQNSSTNMIIESLVSDKDIQFYGNDGGSSVLALALDMSDAGSAFFNNDIYVPDQIIHTGDTDTYMQFHQANSWRVVTAGAERMNIIGASVVFNDDSADQDFRVESNGNTHMLFVDGGNDRVGVACSDPTAYLEIDPAAADTAIFSIRRQDHATVPLFKIVQDSSVSQGTGHCHITSSNRDMSITAGENLDKTKGLYIKTTGNVGIGETTPDDTLHVNKAGGAARIRIGSGTDTYYTTKGYLGDTWYFGSGETGDSVTSTISGGAFTSSNAGGAFIWKTATSGGTPAELMRINSSGNVGIGVNDPLSKLHVHNASSATNRIARFESTIDNLNEYTAITVGKQGSHTASMGIQLLASDQMFLGVTNNGNTFNPGTGGTGTGIFLNKEGTIRTPGQPYTYVNRSSGSQTVGAGAWTSWTFANTVENNGTSMRTAAGVITFPTAGVYLITGLISIENVSATNYLQYRAIFGSHAQQFLGINVVAADSSGANNYYGYDVPVSFMVKVAASETMNIQVFSGGGNMTIRGGTDSSIQVRLMG